MAVGTYKLEIDWDASGTLDGGNEDVTSDLVRVRTTHGRISSNPLAGEASAGVLVAELLNNDDKYNSFNSSSPLSGDLLPGRTVKLSMTAPTAGTLWQGKIASITPSVKWPSSKRVTIKAVGPLADLVGAKVRMSLASSQATGDIIDDILDAADYPSGASYRDIDTGTVTVPVFYPSNERDALGLCRELEASESGWLRETRDGKIRFEDATHRQDHSGTSLETFSDTGLQFTLQFQALKQVEPLDQLYNDIQTEFKLTSTQALAAVWVHPEANTTGDAPLLGPGESVVYFARVPSETDQDAKAVTVWTTPASSTDYTANSANDGSGTDHTSDIGIAVSKFAESMKITVTNNHTGSVYLTKLQARGTAVHASDAVRIVAEDATSQAAYGHRQFLRDAPWVPTSQLAQGWADQQLEIYKDPQPAVALQYQANKSSDHLTEAASRSVSDRITVDADGDVGFGFDQDFFVERISHDIRLGVSHRVEYLLSSTAGLDEFWVLGQTGSTELGQTTRANYG